MRQMNMLRFSSHFLKPGRRVVFFLPILLVLLAALLAPAPLNAARSPEKRLHIPVTVIPGLTAEIRSLRFYATDYGQQDFRRRRYAQTFPAAGIKYLNWEVILEHPFVREEAVRFRIKAVLTGPDGKKVDTSETLAWIEPDADWTQWGKAFRISAWKPGTYKVALKVKGKTLASGSFEVAGDGAAPVAVDFLKQHRLKVEALKFFEGATPGPKFGSRIYLTKFPQASTRYIYWELDLASLGKRTAAVPVAVKSFWYDGAGKLIRKATENFTLKKTYKRPWFSHAYGYAHPGRWKPGKYRVVLKINDMEVASGSFEIVAGKADAPLADFLKQHHLKFVSLRFFEGPERPTAFGTRKYLTKFPQASVRYLHWELILDASGKRTAAVPFAIESLLYAPEGHLLKKKTIDFTLRPDYRMPAFDAGLQGYLLPGRWRPGKYRVVLKIKGQQVATGFFEITAAPQKPQTK